MNFRTLELKKPIRRKQLEKQTGEPSQANLVPKPAIETQLVPRRLKSLLFVDDESKILQGLERQLRPMRNDWEVHFRDSGQKALQFLATKPVDVIVSDMMMPVMDGAELLSEVSKQYPQTVRIVLSGHADRESVWRLIGPAHQYLSKPCDPDELRNAISRAFALRDLLFSDHLQQLANRLTSLPSLPAILIQLNDELNQNDPDLDRVAAIISRDVGMTAKLLKMVNSAYFGLPRTVNTLVAAVVYLGLSTLRSLVFSLQVFSQFSNQAAKGFSIEALARRSWVTGTLARRIAATETKDEELIDQCFISGLLHDVGRLILATSLPVEYSLILAEARGKNLAVWDVERARLSATHAEVGAYLLGIWGLPSPIIEAVAFHHYPSRCTVHGFTPAVIVHIAQAFAQELCTGADRALTGDVDLDLLHRLGLADRLPYWQAICSAEPEQ